MNKLTELLEEWREFTAVAWVEDDSLDDCYNAGRADCADELEASTRGAHLVRWERLADVIDELPESGLRHIVLARESGQHCSPHVGMYYGDFGWRFARHWVGNYVKLCPDARVMVIPLGDGEK